MELYAFQQIVNEKQLFELNKTNDMYKHIVPLWEFWFCFDPQIPECGYYVGGFNLWKYVPLDGSPKYSNQDNREDHSLLTIYIVNIHCPQLSIS